MAVIVALLLACAMPALAGLSPADLKAIAAAPAPNARAPLGLAFTDDTGRARTLGEALGAKPAVLIFADYTCHTLCGPILDFTAAALEKTGLRPGSDYRLVVIGLDPRDGLAAARAMRGERFDSDGSLARATVFLIGRARAIHAATAALGYGYRYDAAHDQYAHPAAAYVLDARGAVTRVLSPLGLDGNDLRLALVAAGKGHVGTFGDQLRLLCYGYDATRGIYTERITSLLSLAALATVIGLAGAIGFMTALARRRSLP